MADVIDPKRLANEAGYKLWTEERIRAADTDMWGHVNNGMYATYFEIGRTTMDHIMDLRPPGSMSIVARQVINYHAELTYPGKFRIGTGVAKIGSRSYDFGYGIFRDGRCIATGETSNVLFDRATRKAVPLPEAFRKALEEILLPELA